REVLDADGRVVAAAPLLPCERIRAAARPLNSDVLSILTVDTRGGPGAFDRGRADGVLGGGQTVYASRERLSTSPAPSRRLANRGDDPPRSPVSTRSTRRAGRRARTADPAPCRDFSPAVGGSPSTTGRCA